MFLIVLMRLIHVVAGVAWAGGAFMLAGFVEPSARALGPDGGKFMQRLAGPGRLPVYLSLVGILTVLSGVYLYVVRSGGLRAGWITSGEGLALTIGGIAGLIAAAVGILIPGRVTGQMAQLGREIQAAGGPPSPAQAAQMQALQRQLALGGRVTALLLVIAVIGMAIAEYL